MTFFHVAGEQSAHRGGDGKQRVIMPLKPAFRSESAQHSHARPGTSKATEEANFSPF
jgi:hypothetical protein